jgi:hypothetical protein
MTTATTPQSTLALDRTLWDLFADSNGNIGAAAPPYAVAQDVASCIRTFTGDCYYDQTLGTPYVPSILGGSPPLSMIAAAVQTQALQVPGVVQAQATITGLTPQGQVVGYVEVVDTNGQSQGVSL